MASKLELSGKCEHEFTLRTATINRDYYEVVYKCVYCQKPVTKFFPLEKLASGEIAVPKVLPR